MFKNQPPFKYILLITDLLVICGALLFAFLINHNKMPTVMAKQHLYVAYHLTISGASIVVCLFTMQFNDLYKRHIVLDRYRQFTLLVKSLIISCAIVLLVVVVSSFKSASIWGRGFIGMFFITAVVLLSLYRTLLVSVVMHYLAKRRIAPRRLLIIGGDDAARKAASSISSDPYANFEVVGFVDDTKEAGSEILIDDEGMDHYHVLGRLSDISGIVERHGVSEILIAMDNLRYEHLVHIVDRCMTAGKVVRIYSNFLRVIAEKLRVEKYADIPVIMLSQIGDKGISWKIKRGIDVMLSLVALICLSPFFLLIALGIKVSSPGPVLFTQERIGKGGKPFRFYKFRSMHVGNDSNRHREFVQNMIREGRTECDSRDIRVYKLTDDRRIFKLGALIRKTSIDEFPQFYNVLKGDMSLVGPRPCLQYEWDCYEEWHRNRLNILPGCTGMWQALGRSTVTFEEMVVLDLYYVSNMSLWLDLRIVLLTFPVLFLGKGGY